MVCAIGEGDLLDGFFGSFFGVEDVGARVEHGEHDIAECAGAIEEFEGLEDESDFFVSDSCQLAHAEFVCGFVVEDIGAGGWFIEASEDVHEGGFA